VSASELISWFAELCLADRPRVGGKGASLGELQRANIAVPPGFVVATSAFEEFIANLEHTAPVRARVEALAPADLDAIGECSKSLRSTIERAPFPTTLRTQLLAAHARLASSVPATNAAVAVRSSATTEDASDASFAGLQDTYLWIMTPEQLLDAVRRCWGSLYSVESITYRRRLGFPESSVAMAVVVQLMVDARTAGVMFTRSPTTGDRSVIAVEGSWGLGSAVVGGEVTPDRWIMNKITGEIRARDVSDKHAEHRPLPAGGVATCAVPEERRREPCLNDAELGELCALARRIEQHYGRPQDIEWAFDRHSGDLMTLQSRPETVWAASDAKPRMTPAAAAHHHVLSLFRGQR
jgi:phosphoenolpyruvate synthase/pyruvate phosphate dikinase